QRKGNLTVKRPLNVDVKFARVAAPLLLLMMCWVNCFQLAAQQDAQTKVAPPTKAESPAPNAPDAAASSQKVQAAGDQGKPADDIQVSFQGANIDMVVQWLAKTTGKSVVKHPRVQCQLTIVSSKKLSARDAIALVYRALALEGFTTIEGTKSILIVPEGQEPKINPEIVTPPRTDLPDGRQRLVKIFPLKNVQATELKDKLRTVLSDKGTID